MRSSILLMPLTAGVMLATLVGCQHTVPTQDAAAAIVGRGESVFRLQNTVMDQLISRQTDEGATPAAEQTALLRLEDALVDSCAHLNRAAGMSASGAQPGLWLNLRVLASLSNCERSAFAAESFLSRAISETPIASIRSP